LDKNVYIEKFLENMAENKYSSRTVSTYRYPLNRFSSFLAETDKDMSFPDVTAELLEKYRLSLIRADFSPESTVTYLQAVRKFFRYLEEKSYIFSNPAENFRNPRGKRRIMQIPSAEDMEALISAVNITTLIGMRDRAMIETAYGCALRMNEMLKLTIFSCDFKAGTLRLTGKGSKERVLPLGSESVKWLKTYMEKSRPHLLGDSKCDILWLSREGKPLIERTYQSMLHKYAEKAHLKGKVTGHSMRRACATHMLENGAHPVAIQHLLGHASLQHLGSYLNVTVTELRKTHENSRPGK